MLKRLGLISIVVTFLFAGIGMLLQHPVDNGPGNFYQNILENEFYWTLSHVILLFSVMAMLPAGAVMYQTLHKNGAKILGLIALLLLAPTSIFQAGQYAIDFVAPIAASIGGDAISAYNKIDQTMPASVLFYGLSNLSILMLMLLSICLVWNGSLDKKGSIILMLNWGLVLIGNLIDPMFQRVMIILLSVNFIPFVKNNWTD